MPKKAIVGIITFVLLAMSVGPSQAEDLDSVLMTEGVYDVVTDDGISGRAYVGEAGFKTRIAELQEIAAAIVERSEINQVSLRKLMLIKKEIFALETAVDSRRDKIAKADEELNATNKDFVGDPAIRPPTDCQLSPADVDAWKTIYSGAAAGTEALAQFSGIGTCLAKARVFAYASDGNTVSEDTDSTGGAYVSDIDLYVDAAVSAGSGNCYYASAWIIFNAGRPMLYVVYDPDGCYCPECS